METEYGIVVRGAPDANPIAASSLLINAYVTGGESGAQGARLGDGADARVSWDFEDESPDRDARGSRTPGSMAPIVERNLVNTVLTNGARYYVDHAHPEISTPECADAKAVVVYDRAAELIALRSMDAARALLPAGQEIVLYKNNSDRKGNSYGTHENYMMDRSTPFGQIVTGILPHFITRQIFAGAGKVGSEIPNVTSKEVPFQISQRADFFEEEVGLETTIKRPIVNTRDEPHADPRKYRRLHVILGDANLSEIANFLKVGTTALVLAMIEDDFFDKEILLRSPVDALRVVSRDLSLAKPLELMDGSTATALEIQWELLRRVQAYSDERGLDCVGAEAGLEVLRRWEAVLAGLENDFMDLADQLDWVAKYRLINGYRERNGLRWRDAKLAAMDLQYHDLRPEKSLFLRVGMQRITTDEEVSRATTEPPEDTRAYFRGRCLQKWPGEIVSANWDSLVFDVGGDSLRRVPMLEPSRGTAEYVGSLLDESSTPLELLERLGS